MMASDFISLWGRLFIARAIKMPAAEANDKK